MINKGDQPMLPPSNCPTILVIILVCVFCCSAAWHEDMDRKFQSQNSLGEQPKQGSKSTLNRRVSLNGLEKNDQQVIDLQNILCAIVSSWKKKILLKRNKIRTSC